RIGNSRGSHGKRVLEDPGAGDKDKVVSPHPREDAPDIDALTEKPCNLCPQSTASGVTAVPVQRDRGDAVVAGHSFGTHAHGVDHGLGVLATKAPKDGLEGSVVADVAGPEEPEEANSGPSRTHTGVAVSRGATSHLRVQTVVVPCGVVTTRIVMGLHQVRIGPGAR